MARIRHITCECGFAATDGHWPDGRCPKCNLPSTRSGTRWIRVEDEFKDPDAWLRTGWLASINGGLTKDATSGS